MKKRSEVVLAMAFVLMMTGCGDSNSAEEPIESDSQIMENVEQRDTAENTASEDIDDATESSETQEAEQNIQSIFDELAGLEYRQYTCDGLPEYMLTADDGTTYYMNFSDKWVWRGQQEAELPDGIISWLEANKDAVSLEKVYLDY